ncbi:MAG: ORF6N domain-containing protein [Sphingobacterium sp.]|nr:ORF6N domain-containing protein [Sphingobacterium sp.]
MLTFAQIDKIHGRPEGTAKRNFTENNSRLIEGEDFYLVDFSQKNEFRPFGIEIPPRGLTVVTESGYLLLVKSFTDDLAWQVQKQLVKVYFRYRELIAPAPAPAPEVETLSQRQYAELKNLLRPGHWILQPEWVQLAMHDHVRSTLNVRHLKDIPADQFNTALIVARDTAARADFIGDVLQTALQELTREVIAAGAPCTQVLVREWKKRFKTDVPKYPNWHEIQRQLQAATQASVLALD